MSHTLYAIERDLAALDALLSECGGDVTDATAAAAIAAWESDLESNLIGKIDSYCGLIAEIESRANARLAEASRLQSLATTDRKSADALRARLHSAFESRGLPRIQTPRFAVSLVRNGGKAPLDIRVGADQLPEWAINRETIVTPNKDAIRARLEAGEALEFASMMNRQTRISIK